MGTVSESCKNYNMMNLIYLACLSAVMAAPPQQAPVYPTPAPTQGYHPDIGQTNVGGYGVNKDPYSLVNIVHLLNFVFKSSTIFRAGQGAGNFVEIDMCPILLVAACLSTKKK